MVHTLRLDNYSPTPRKLVLGTNSSYGTESIKIERGAGWDGLNLTATWHIPGREEPLRVALLDGDAMDVPPEVTKEAKDGVLVLAGLASGVQRASCNVEYLIIEQAGVYGGADAEPTPELAAQVLQAVQDARDAAKDADQRATNAENVANSVREDADNGKFIGPVGPEGPAGKDGVQIDDAAVSEDAPWSSKHIINMLCPPLEESGNPVVCYPVAGYPLGVKAKLKPVQEGSGTPSPENIRPIKGRDSVTVERCGENLLNPKENNYNTYTPYGLTINYIGDNKVHLKGTYNLEGGGGSFVILSTNQKLLAGRNLKITGFTIEGTKQTYRLYGLRTKDETAIAMNAEFADGDVIDMTVAIVVSKDTPTAYTPYIGQTNTLTLPETVYGGEVDAVSGEGQETWKTLTLNGTEALSDNGTVASRKEQQWALYDVLKPYSGTFGISSHFDNINGYISYPANFVCISKTSIVFHVASDGPFATVDALKSYLAAQYAAGTPVQIAYKLAEPVPFTATGAQAIPALAGVNTVLTDADSATVTGRADPIKRITDLEAAVASIN